ncbi:MAG: hypothetical protein IM638_13220 [Bacteroidetes bacterium]|nr:hypothetical protein [Bacteroidota bacterium]
MNRLFSTANGRRPLAPAFINRLDKWLLLNYPTLWATRVHLFLWYALIGYAVIYGTFWILPDDPRTRSSLAEHQVVVGLLAALGIILWLIYLLRFNTFKRFGQPHTLAPALQLLLFWAVFFMAGFSILLPAFVETQSARSEYTPDELTDAVNQINYCVNVAEHKYNPVQLGRDTVIFVASETEARKKVIQNEHYRNNNMLVGDTLNDTVIDVQSRYRTNVTWEPVDNKDGWLQREDTLVLLGDSGLVHYRWFNIMYVSENQSPDYSSVRPLTAYQLYHLIYKKKTVSETEALSTLNKLSLKFAGIPIRNDYGPESNYRKRTDSLYVPPLNEYQEDIFDSYLFDYRYNLSAIDNAIENIERRMYRYERSNFLFTNCLVLAYVSLALSLILLMFRHSSLKTFAATFLAGTVLAVTTGVGLALFNARTESVLITILVYIVAFHVFSLGLFGARKRSLWHGITLQLSVYSVFFIPLIGVGLYYRYLHNNYPDNFNSPHDVLFKNESFHYALAQCGGLALLLGLLLLLYGRMMRKWYAQPEE